MDPQLIAADPDNRLYGGAELIRMDAEAIRDTILQLSDKLNPKAFGPAVPVMADQVGRWVIGKENLNAGRPGDKIDMKGEEFRRSIYIQVRRSRRYQCSTPLTCLRCPRTATSGVHQPVLPNHC